MRKVVKSFSSNQIVAHMKLGKGYGKYNTYVFIALEVLGNDKSKYNIYVIFCLEVGS